MTLGAKPLSLSSLLSASLLLTLSGCGGKKVVITQPIDFAVPKEIAQAFEVKEFKPEDVAPKADKEVKTKKKTKDKSKKGAKKDEVKAASAGFVVPNRRPTADPIWVGEKVWMDVTWLSTKAGEFLIEVLPYKNIGGRKVYDFKGTAKTSDFFSMVYKAEDWIESFVDYEGWFPYKFMLHGDETKHIRNHLELFDHGAKKQYVHIYDNRVQKGEVHEEKGFKELVPFSQDSMSSLHYIRTHNLADGTSFRFPMSTSGKQWETEIVVLGREEVDTRMGDMKAIKTKVLTRFNGALQSKGDTFIWFSDDERKFPLRFEAKVRIGWVAGIAKKIEYGTKPEPEKPKTGMKDRQETAVPAPSLDVLMPSTDGVSAVDKGGALGPTPADSAQQTLGRKNRPWFRQLLQSFDDSEDSE